MSRDSSESLAQLAASRPLPSRAAPVGAEDWELDGELGIAGQLSGVVSGVRNTVQRDWVEWFSDGAHPIVPSVDWDELLVRVAMESEEHIMAPESGLVTQLSTLDTSAEHVVTLRFLGRNKMDPRSVVLLADEQFETCVAIKAALPAVDQL